MLHRLALDRGSGQCCIRNEIRFSKLADKGFALRQDSLFTGISCLFRLFSRRCPPSKTLQTVVINIMYGIGRKFTQNGRKFETMTAPGRGNRQPLHIWVPEIKKSPSSEHKAHSGAHYRKVHRLRNRGFEKRTSRINRFLLNYRQKVLKNLSYNLVHDWRSSKGCLY